MHKHGKYIELSDGGSAFIDSIPDECDHNWNGDEYFVAKSGKVIYWHTYRQWASYTSQLRGRLIVDYHEQIDDPIVENGVMCSKCKKQFNPLW